METFFVGVLIIIFAKTLNTVKGDVGREGIFKASKVSARFTVTKNISVGSVLDCAHSCRAEVACEAFRHRNFPPNDAINCQLTKGKPEMLGKVDESEEWTVYTLQSFELGVPVKSLDRDDYDIVFPGPEANGYLDLPNIISKELSGFTYSAWFKFNPGIDSYQLFSYTTENATKVIDLRFKTTFRNLVAKFNQELFGELLRTPMIPVSDGFWHHVGFSWSGISGKCTLLIDGVLLAMYEDIFQGKKIPPGGNATIGITTLDTATRYLVGRISRVNLWSGAKTGHEIEQLAKSPGSDAGDLLSWRMVQDYVSGKLSVVRPSTAAFTGNGMNYELTLPLSEEIRYPGPSEDIKVLSIVLWFKGNTLFLAYDTDETFVFGYKSSSLISTINNFDTNRTVTGNSNYWHFLCLDWDGEKSRLKYYYDGQLLSGKIDSVELNAHLPAGKDFILRLDSEVGTLTQLNIWNYRLFSESILAMSAGGYNVHGNLLSWITLQNYVNVENITRGSEIYLPGFAVLARRTEWCNGVHPSTACSGQLLARLGGDLKKESMLWRCYCPSSLLPSKATYDFKALRSYYRTSHTDLTRIN